MEEGNQLQKAEDFLQNEQFLLWLREPDQELHQYWEKWLQQHPDKITEVAMAKRLYAMMHTHTDTLPSVGDKQEVWQKITAVLEEEEEEAAAEAEYLLPVQTLYKRKRLTGIAAVLVLLAGIAGFWYFTGAGTGKESPVILSLVNKDNITRFYLPDSTLVTLNKNSTCKYGPDFNTKNSREIWITGEAFLDVSHRYNTNGKRKPFIVHMINMDIEVLGTRFNVINREGQGQVVLERGSVKVNGAKEQMVLQPGEMVVTSGKGLRKLKVKPLLYTSWITGTLELEANSLTEIMDLLRYSHGYKVVYKGDMKTRTQLVSGTIRVTDQADFLKTLSTAFGISIHTNHDTLTIVHNQKP